MKTKKPDRFERMVRKQTGNDPFVLDSEIIALLRKEHKAVMRMVKKEFSKMEAITLDRTNSNGRIVMAHYKALQCRDILDQLKRRAM